MIKVKKRKILLLPGDGIGSEVIAEVKKIIEFFEPPSNNNNKWFTEIYYAPDGAGCSYTIRQTEEKTIIEIGCGC